jgi:RND family efflux transporter MFP subunit
MKYSGIVFLSVIIFFLSCSSNQNKKNAASASASIKYTTAIIQKGGVSTVIKLPANLAAYQEVSIFPKVNGYVKTVLVDMGSKVTQGQLLMVLEAPELEQAVVQAKENYERVKADFFIDKDKYSRLKEAARTAGAISPLDISVMKSKMEADSALANAAKANWQVQQTMLSYLSVTAPFTGVITERNVHPGALVSNSEKDKPMLELKQIDHLRLQFDVPENMAATLKNNDSVTFYLSAAFPGKKFVGVISRKSMNTNLEYRSEKMEIDVFNKNDLFTPGMYVDVELSSAGHKDALVVPKSAVVTNTERKFIMVKRNGKIEKVDVTTGNETADKIEVYGNISEGESVITNPNEES